MIYIIAIIIGIIILGALMNLFEFLSDKIGKTTVVIVLVLDVIAYFAGSLRTVFIVTVIGIGISLLVRQIGKAGQHISNTIENHDKEKKKIAQINQNTQLSREAHENEAALQAELNANCRWLGYMDVQAWSIKLPNYKSKRYLKSFEEITQNFAKQMEQQNITQNDDWFQPFLMYIIEHPQGGTITKMLNEVKCPQLNITHSTPDKELLYERLERGTKRVSKDVPPLFLERSLSEINEPLFVPTKYALKLYTSNVEDSQEISHTEEINFNDL